MEICERHKEHTFGGIVIQQVPSALFVLEKLFRLNPDIKRVVELGTGNGALTILFGLIMKARGGMVLTMDKAKKWKPEQFFSLPVTFKRGNVFNVDVLDRVERFISGERALVFCDDGDKPREMLFYGTYIKAGDLILAHDYGHGEDWVEITDADVKPLLAITEPHFQDEFDLYGTRILSRRRI